MASLPNDKASTAWVAGPGMQHVCGDFKYQACSEILPVHDQRDEEGRGGSRSQERTSQVPDGIYIAAKLQTQLLQLPHTCDPRRRKVSVGIWQNYSPSVQRPLSTYSGVRCAGTIS